MTTTVKPGSGRTGDISGSWKQFGPPGGAHVVPRARQVPTPPPVVPTTFVPPSEAPTEPIPVGVRFCCGRGELLGREPGRPGSGPPTSRRPRSRRLGDAVLNILAVFGVLCIVLTVVAFVGNYSIILFKTGSMDPTIPQGSAAVVHEIPAAQVKVGDIVTVDRGPGLKPITHRAISVTPIGGGRVEIEMQGDANPNPDPEPYRVSTVKKVLWHVPGLARQVVWLSHPYVLAAITLGAALLVLWTFWPKPSTGRRPDDA